MSSQVAGKPPQAHPKYRPDIDGLRALAVLAVVAFHAFPSRLKGGFIGVDIFFVISGYLISTIIFGNLDKGTFSFADFYARRVKRIFPALILVLLACLAFGWFVLLADEFQQLGKHIAGGAAFVSNLVLSNESGYFDNASDSKPLLHLWSLSIEEQFYFFWPLLLWLAHKKRFNLFIVGLLIASVSFCLNIYLIRSDPTATFYYPQTRFWEMMAGSMLAWVTLYRPGLSASGWSKYLVNAVSVLALSLIIYGFWHLDTHVGFPGKWALLPVTGAFLLIFAGPSALVNRTLLSNRLVIWFGLISYPLYLWHWPILSFGRIITNGPPPFLFKLFAILISILLAWLTVEFIEKPFRYGHQKVKLKIAFLCASVALLGAIGIAVNYGDFSQSHSFNALAIKRKGSEHCIGYSCAWYKGKDDWLFLGNTYDASVAKLKLVNTPPETGIEMTRRTFSGLASSAAKYNTKVAIIVGNDKTSIYPEFLPDSIKPSSVPYISFFLERLRGIQNLTVYDPREDLLRRKDSEGLLYWKTDTHWNNKGAFLAYSGFSNLLGLPALSVKFRQAPPHRGDLVDISKLTDFPMSEGDSWDVVWRKAPAWKEILLSGEKATTFGKPSISLNQEALSDSYIWVVGDSFAGQLKPFFNATFREVRYIGHWTDKLQGLAVELDKAVIKPDMIVVIKVERSF